MSLFGLLPAPSQVVWDREDDAREAKLRRQERRSALMKKVTSAPPYGKRKNWIPKNEEDFGDGGAFPEINVPQHPLGMGETGQRTTSNALAIQLDAQGKVKYDILARQGHSKDKIVYSKLSDLLPAEILSENDPIIQKRSEEEAEETTEKTKRALEKIIEGKIAAAMPVRRAEKKGPAQFIRYTPSQQGESFNSGAKQRVVRVVEAQVDPMEPPRFKINQKIPRGPPSPPAPVLTSPPRRLTVKEQREWKIPPSISNWKNPMGFTIPLHQRLAADGRGLQQQHVNERLYKLRVALSIADRKAREGVEMRAQLERKLAEKEKEKKEDHLRQLAEKARNERAGLKSVDKNEELLEREQIRQERHNDRVRERNLARAAPDKRSRLQRERERDISEQIALGVPAKNVNTNGDQIFDQRLFNTTKGMDSGFGRDDEYSVYDKPWKDAGSLGSHIYRPSKNIDQYKYDEDLENLKTTSRFVPDKEFSGTDRTGAGRSGPVQFEKEEEDIFGLDQFLKKAKTTTTAKRKDDGHSKTDDTRNKRRRH